MTDLLSQLASYIATKLSLTVGTQVFYNCLPDTPDKGIVVQEEQTNAMVPPQIDAEVHKIHVIVRDTTYELANTLSRSCWRWLFTDIANYDIDKREDTNGFITLLNGLRIKLSLYGNPVWEKEDQRGREYYGFYCLIITKR